MAQRRQALERWVLENAYTSLVIEKEVNTAYLPLIATHKDEDFIESESSDLFGCFAASTVEATHDFETEYAEACAEVTKLSSVLRKRLGGEAFSSKGSEDYPLFVEDKGAWDDAFASDIEELVHELNDARAAAPKEQPPVSVAARQAMDPVDLTTSPDQKPPAAPVQSANLSTVIGSIPPATKWNPAGALNPTALLQTQLGPKNPPESRLSAELNRRAVSPLPQPSFVSASSRIGVPTESNPNKQFVSAASESWSNDGQTPQDDGNRSKPFRPPARAPLPSGAFQQNNRNAANIRPSQPLVRPAPNGKAAPFATAAQQQQQQNDAEPVHPRLKGLDPDLIERIENEILEQGQPVTMKDIAGLEFAKQTIEELVVWPIRNPELYTGLRQVPKGLLLFGPPGTGKTLIGKAIAHECKATFFSVSASTLTSKWIGEGEKMVRALFAVAAVRQPSVVFIDEIDSLLTQRTSDENEASRRIKTEFLVQFDGCASNSSDIVLVIGATNRPQELDEAARRRFVRRLYIPLPDQTTRVSLLSHLLTKNEHRLSESEIRDVGKRTAGYSGADVTNLAQEASMGPIREMMRRPKDLGAAANPKELRPISVKDFEIALRSVKASVSNTDLSLYEKWNAEFGSQAHPGSVAIDGDFPPSPSTRTSQATSLVVSSPM